MDAEGVIVKLIGTPTVARMCGVSANTVNYWRSHQMGPPDEGKVASVRGGPPRVAYDSAKVQAWIEQRPERPSMPKGKSGGRCCPVCSGKQVGVRDSRPRTDDAGMSVVTRWLSCQDCEARWVTRESFCHLVAVDGARVSRAAVRPKVSAGPVPSDFRVSLG